MADQKIVRLVRLLLEKTKAREMRWEETADPSTFQCSLSNYSILISQRSFQNVSEPTQFVKICNEEGKTIEEVSDAVPHFWEVSNLENYSKWRDAMRWASKRRSMKCSTCLKQSRAKARAVADSLTDWLSRTRLLWFNRCKLLSTALTMLD
jgi:hypothetical protein